MYNAITNVFNSVYNIECTEAHPTEYSYTLYIYYLMMNQIKATSKPKIAEEVDEIDPNISEVDVSLT